MRERPILFSAPMVRALLDGTKTQTRRVVKLPAAPDRLGEWQATTIGGPDGGRTTAGDTVPHQGAIWHTRTGKTLCSPYGQPGDRLWVRETHAPQADCWGSWERWLCGAGGEAPILHYAADFKPFQNDNGFVIRKPFIEKWRPSIHMPRWASRIDLAVTGVRVERLQEISEADAIAEGLSPQPGGGWGLADGSHFHGSDPRISYWSLWDAINGEGSAEANPWVWCVEFKRIAK
jgi:hypothetical protein